MKNTKNKAGAHSARNDKAAKAANLPVEVGAVLSVVAHVFNAPSIEKTFAALAGNLTVEETFELVKLMRVESVARDSGYVPTNDNILEPDTRFVKA